MFLQALLLSDLRSQRPALDAAWRGSPVRVQRALSLRQSSQPGKGFSVASKLLGSIWDLISLGCNTESALDGCLTIPPQGLVESLVCGIGPKKCSNGVRNITVLICKCRRCLQVRPLCLLLSSQPGNAATEPTAIVAAWRRGTASEFA